MTGTGYGIAGHKNRYANPGIRLQNWVEDTSGQRLAEQKRSSAPYTISKTTVAKDSYIDPKRMVDRAGRINNGLNLSEMIERNRTGLSYHTLFSHGKQEDFNPRNTYVTVSELGYTGKEAQPQVHKVMHAKDLQANLRLSLTRRFHREHELEERAVTCLTTTTKDMTKLVRDLRPQREKPTALLRTFGRSSAFTDAHQVYTSTRA